MAKGSTFSNDFLKLIYNATAIANIADNAATSPLTNIYVALHTADPGVGGTQGTSEISYIGYNRSAVARTTGGWTVTGNSVSPVATVNGFGQMTGGTGGLATHFSTGVQSSGSTKILHKGVIGSRLGPFSCTAAGTLTIPGLSGVAVDDRFIAESVDGSTLPTGLTEGTAYWVKTVSGNDITLSATQGGAAISISAAGDGLAWRATPISVTTGVTPQLGTATAIIEG